MAECAGTIDRVHLGIPEIAEDGGNSQPTTPANVTMLLGVLDIKDAITGKVRAHPHEYEAGFSGGYLLR